MSGALLAGLSALSATVTGGGLATVSPAAVMGTTAGAGSVTSSPATVSPHGTGPYTYAWSRVSGSSTAVATAPSAASTAFTDFVGNGDVQLSQWKCTVTDTGAGGVTGVVFVSVTIRSTSTV